MTEIQSSILDSLKDDPEAMAIYSKMAKEQGFSSVEALIQTFTPYEER